MVYLSRPPVFRREVLTGLNGATNTSRDILGIVVPCFPSAVAIWQIDHERPAIAGDGGVICTAWNQRHEIADVVRIPVAGPTALSRRDVHIVRVLLRAVAVPMIVCPRGHVFSPLIRDGERTQAVRRVGIHHARAGRCPDTLRRDTQQRTEERGKRHARVRTVAIHVHADALAWEAGWAVEEDLHSRRGARLL